MPVTPLLTAVRASYVGSLCEVLRASPGAHVEPVFRTSDGSPATEGPLSLPTRADLIPVQGANAGMPLTVDSAERLQFATVSIALDTTKVSLSPFVWDWIDLGVLGLQEREVTAILVQWFMSWFDAEDHNEVSRDGLYGVVHYMSEPVAAEGAIVVALDLGSSPPAALEDLFSRLSAAGASEIRVA